MSVPDIRRLEDLLDAALQRPESERLSFLKGACAGNEALEREVVELLVALEQGGDFLDELSREVAEAAGLEFDLALRPQLPVGPYRAIQLIGQGGMGAVYLAERVDGQFDHQVALKLLHLDMVQPTIQARFLAERQILARLSHPHIARLLDGGLTDEGRPYIVMEYVDGKSLTEHCREHELDLTQRLKLFLELVEAVDYLHRNLVVHRDLKPRNVLVDREGRVRLLDFGIAKLLDSDDPDLSEKTQTNERLMTPAYAAPEQATGGAVTTATDVYALGGVLYELLCGIRHRDAGPDGVPTTDDAVPAPSRRLRLVAKEDSDHRVSWKQLTGDLDTICLKALRPEPERRYASVDQLGEDIRRLLGGLPVHARRSTWRYRAGKWVRRHRVETAAAVMLLIFLGVGLVRERGLRDEAEAARVAAQEEALRAVAVSKFLSNLLSSIDPRKAQGQDLSVAEVIDEAASRLEGETALEDHPAAEAEVRLTLGRTYRSLSRWEDAERHLKRALELREGATTEPLGLLEVRQALAVTAYRSGRYGEAEQPLLEVLEGRRTILGEEHPDTLGTMGHLANLYWYQDRLGDAERLDRQTYEVRSRSLGPDHPDTLRSLNGLATTLFARAQFATAAEHFAHALEGQRLQLGENHPDTLRLKGNLAAAYTELGRYRQAEPLQRDVAGALDRILGERDPARSRAWHNLAVTLLNLGHYEEAEEILQATIAERKKLELVESGLFSESLLAELYREVGRWEESELLYRSVIEGMLREYGADHPRVLRTEVGLADLQLRRGNISGADERIQRALAVLDSTVGPAHTDTLGGRSLLAGVRLAQGRLDEAQELIEKTIADGEAALSLEHPVVEAAVLEKVRILLATDRANQARTLVEQIHSARLNRLGPEHPATQEASLLKKQITGS